MGEPIGPGQAEEAQQPSSALALRDHDRPKNSEILVGSIAVTALAVLLLWSAFGGKGEPAAILGEVSPEQALDARAVPSEAFITLTGQPDVSKIAPAYVMGPGGGHDLWLALQGAPRLVIQCRADHPLGRAIRAAGPGNALRRDPAAAAAVARPWTLDGRIYDVTRRERLLGQVSSSSVRLYAESALGAKPDEPLRLLVVGETPASARAAERTAAVVAALLAVLAIVLWTVTIRSFARDRAARWAGGVSR